LTEPNEIDLAFPDMLDLSRQLIGKIVWHFQDAVTIAMEQISGGYREPSDIDGFPELNDMGIRALAM